MMQQFEGKTKGGREGGGLTILHIFVTQQPLKPNMANIQRAREYGVTYFLDLFLMGWNLKLYKSLLTSHLR